MMNNKIRLEDDETRRRQDQEMKNNKIGLEDDETRR